MISVDYEKCCVWKEDRSLEQDDLLMTKDEQQEFLAAIATRFCPQCGGMIIQNPKGRKKLFCSDECRFAWKHKHPRIENWKKTKKLVCPVCGKEYLAYLSENVVRKYCSRACANTGRTVDMRREAEHDRNSQEVGSDQSRR